MTSTYDKYLKYKQKYLQAKHRQFGGVISDNIKKQYTGAGCMIIDDNGNILLVMEKRFNWNTIGGKIDWHDYKEKNDSDLNYVLKESAIREVQEETAYLLNLEHKDLIDSKYVEVSDTMSGIHRTYIVKISASEMKDIADKFLTHKATIPDEYKAEHHINTVAIKKINIEELKKQLGVCATNDKEYNLETKVVSTKYNYLCQIDGCELIVNRRLRDVINEAVKQNLI